MNFKLKALVAAFALVAVAGQASASVAAPTATTPSDLIFFAIDQGTGNSFAFDLGAVANLSSLNQSITGSAFSSYLAAEGGSLANTTWGLAYDQGSIASNSLWGTTVTAGSVIGSETSSKMSSGRVVFNSFLLGTAMTVAGTSAYTNAANASNLTVGMGNNWGGQAVFTTDNAVGIAADFYTVTAATSAAGGVLVKSGITFDGTTVAAVPEPETYSMLAAGLLMLGAVARRRKA